MCAVWAVLLFLCAATYLWYKIQRRKFKDVEKIPGPPVKFLFGNTLEFGSNLIDIFYNTHRLIKKYGPLVRIWQGPFLLKLFVTGPDYVEYFLTSQVHIRKSDGYNFLHPWIGLGLVTSTGEKWRKHRKIISPAFRLKNLEQFSEYFNRSGKILANKLKQKVGEPIDIFPYIKLYSFEVLCESSLKFCPKTQESSDHSLISATEGFMDIFTTRIFSLFSRYDFFFRFTKYYRMQKKYVATLRDFTEKIIAQRKSERVLDAAESETDDFGIKKKKAFVDVLLDSEWLSDQEIRDEVNTFFGAGHETVTVAISFGLYELAKHKEIQERILSEIHETIGRDNDSEITLKQLQEMKYLDCVMKEILRMYPPVPFFERELEEDVVLDGIKIPKGTMVSFHPYVQHRNEKFFPNPENFEPDRFLDYNVGKRHQFAMIPFSAGPRNCIGVKYALMNCKITMANVIRNFELLPVEPKHEPILATATMLRSVNGLPINLELRK